MIDGNSQIAPDKIPQNRSNMNFVLMILGRVVSELGTSVFSFAISLYVLSMTKSAALYSVVLSFSILPNIFTNIAGGIIVDRCNKKRLIVGSDLLSGLIIFVFLLFFSLQPANIIIIIAFNMLLAMAQSLFSLTMTSSIANVVNSKQVPKLNSVFTGYGSTISIIGPFIGALVYQNFSMTLIFTINGFSFLLSGLSEMFIIFYCENKKEQNTSIHFIKNYKEVFSFIKENTQIRILLIINTFLILIFAPLGSIIVPYVSYNVIHVSKFQLAFIQGSLAAGSLIASFIMTLIPSVSALLKRLFLLIHMQSFAILMLCIPAFFTAADQSKWIATILFSVCLVFLGVVAVVRSIPIFTHFQTEISEKIRGRFFAVQNTLSAFFSFIGMWSYGVLLDHVTWYILIIISGISSLLFIGLFQYIDKKEKLLCYKEHDIAENK